MEEHRAKYIKQEGLRRQMLIKACHA